MIATPGCNFVEVFAITDERNPSDEHVRQYEEQSAEAAKLLVAGGVQLRHGQRVDSTTRTLDLLCRRHDVDVLTTFTAQTNRLVWLALCHLLLSHLDVGQFYRLHD